MERTKGEAWWEAAVAMTATPAERPEVRAWVQSGGSAFWRAVEEGTLCRQE